ncbi:hypothetical protein JB92DRAFT_802104 [Gautieria morchelliformis]|nr:hypothetical protein JB92DRAFT_802104 [Gautieria morchelliformis]
MGYKHNHIPMGVFRFVTLPCAKMRLRCVQRSSSAKGPRSCLCTVVDAVLSTNGALSAEVLVHFSRSWTYMTYSMATSKLSECSFADVVFHETNCHPLVLHYLMELAAAGSRRSIAERLAQLNSQRLGQPLLPPETHHTDHTLAFGLPMGILCGVTAKHKSMGVNMGDLAMDPAPDLAVLIARSVTIVLPCTKRRSPKFPIHLRAMSSADNHPCASDSGVSCISSTRLLFYHPDYR